MRNSERTWWRALGVITLIAISVSSGPAAAQTAQTSPVEEAVRWLTSYDEAGMDGWKVIESSADIPLDSSFRASAASNVELHAPIVRDEDEATVVSLYGWTDSLGILALWEITVHGGNVVFVHGEVVSVAGAASGSRVSEGRFLPTPGKLIKHEAVTESVVPQQVAGPRVQVSDHWVEIHEDPAATQSTRISVDGFGSDEAGALAIMESSAALEAIGQFDQSAALLQSSDQATIPGDAFDFAPNAFGVAATSFQDVIATFSLPPATPPGTYAGNITVSSSGGAATIGVQVMVTVLQVDIDIKPGSDPNSVNCSNENALIAVAVLTTDTFDALSVDHAIVSLEGATEYHVEKQSGEAKRHEEDVDGDGDLDLVLHFRLGETSLTCDSMDATLQGETYDGLLIEGVDSVSMVNHGGGRD